MIEVRLDVIITANDDGEADEIIQSLNDQSQSWPVLPIVSVQERSRELVRERP